MAKQSAAELTKELFDKVGGIKLNDAAAIFGTTSKESMLQNFRKSIIALNKTLAENQTYEQVMAAYEEVAAEVDTAGVTGLISDTEMTEYYELIDKIWATIEKEKGKKA